VGEFIGSFKYLLLQNEEEAAAATAALFVVGTLLLTKKKKTEFLGRRRSHMNEGAVRSFLRWPPQ
jgi:hypothetical protein